MMKFKIWIETITLITQDPVLYKFSNKQFKDLVISDVLIRHYVTINIVNCVQMFTIRLLYVSSTEGSNIIIEI